MKKNHNYLICIIAIICLLANCDANKRIVHYDNQTDYDLFIIPYDNATWTKFTLHAHEILEFDYNSPDCPGEYFEYSKAGLVYCYIESDDYYVFRYHILPK